MRIVLVNLTNNPYTMNVSVGFLGYFIFNCMYVYLYVCGIYKHVYMRANTQIPEEGTGHP